MKLAFNKKILDATHPDRELFLECIFAKKLSHGAYERGFREAVLSVGLPTCSYAVWVFEVTYFSSAEYVNKRYYSDLVSVRGRPKI